MVEEVERHLTDTWGSEETRRDVEAIRAQIAKDSESSPANQSCDAVAPNTSDSEPRPSEDQPVPEDAVPEDANRERPDVADDVSDASASIAAVAAAVKAMVKADRKIGCLKTLQGHMWRRGYAEGKLIGHLFEDVPAALQSWRAAGAKLFVYSSGSVAAQKLLFGHTEHGDLNELFSGNYDTAVGPKTDPGSYTAIAAAIAVPAARVLFLTDIAAEARAARESGMQVLLSVRPGNVSGLQAGESFPSTTTFADVSIVNDKKMKGQSQP